MALHEKAYGVWKNEGKISFFKKGTRYVLDRTIGPLYNSSIRPLLPTTGEYVKMNGVPCGIMEKRKFDDITPWRAPYFDNPDYASENIDLLREHVQEGDDVVIVGGGWGVTAAVAGEQAGPEGTIHIYEGADEMITVIESTLEINGLYDQTHVHHALVGPAISLRGHAGDAKITEPEDLPQCDILELNCEGAELEILENIEIRPSVVIVGTHGHYGSPDYKVEEVLENHGYEIQTKYVQNPEIDASFLGAIYDGN
jgi:hypothetical protein